MARPAWRNEAAGAAVATDEGTGGDGLGGRLGSGRQWLSWIGLDDLLDVYYRALYDTRLTGAVNAVAPAPLRNADYTRSLAGVLHRPAVSPCPSGGCPPALRRVSPCPSGGWAHRLRGECPQPVPSLGPWLLLGKQGAHELAAANQRVMPTKLETLGHRFRHPSIDDALAHELGHG